MCKLVWTWELLKELPKLWLLLNVHHSQGLTFYTKYDIFNSEELFSFGVCFRNYDFLCLSNSLCFLLCYCDNENCSLVDTEACIRGVLYKKVFLKISQNSQENAYARVCYNKVAALRPATLLKKRLWHMCFPVNFVKFLRTPFL